MTASSAPRFLADENFNNDLLRALLRRLPSLDVVRVQDTPIVGADDATLLAWAAQEGRILLTHDVRTIPGFAYARVRAGEAMRGVIEVADDLPLGAALEDLLILIELVHPDELSVHTVALKQSENRWWCDARPGMQSPGYGMRRINPA